MSDAKVPRCAQCNDTGVIETGNNDLPCSCPASDKAEFNVGADGPVTGAEVRRHFLNGSPEPLSTLGLRVADLPGRRPAAPPPNRERELTNDERFRWGECPVCHAADGEHCYADVGVQLGVKANGERMKDGDGAHLARLQNAPFRVKEVAVR